MHQGEGRGCRSGDGGISNRGKDDKLEGSVVGNGSTEEQTPTTNVFQEDGDLELIETDVVRSLINGIPSIEFLERVNQILVKDMALTVAIKLLGQSFGYSALYNKVCSLWKPSKPFHLMDVENG